MNLTLILGFATSILKNLHKDSAEVIHLTLSTLLTKVQFYSCQNFVQSVLCNTNSVVFIHLLDFIDLTRNSCEKCNDSPLAGIEPAALRFRYSALINCDRLCENVVKVNCSYRVRHSCEWDR